MFREGDAFFGGRAVHGSDHLWITINEPALQDGTALHVNISSVTPGCLPLPSGVHC